MKIEVTKNGHACFNKKKNKKNQNMKKETICTILRNFIFKIV